MDGCLSSSVGPDSCSVSQPASSGPQNPSGPFRLAQPPQQHTQQSRDPRKRSRPIAASLQQVVGNTSSADAPLDLSQDEQGTPSRLRPTNLVVPTKSTSWAWGKQMALQPKDNNTVFWCTKCEKQMKCPNRGAGLAEQHFRSVHPELVEAALAARSANTGALPRAFLNLANRAHQDAVVNWVIGTMQPLSVVENDLFRKVGRHPMLYATCCTWKTLKGSFICNNWWGILLLLAPPADVYRLVR